MKKVLLYSVVAMALCGCGNSQKEKPFVYNVENSGANIPVKIISDLNALSVCDTLPDIFAWSDGSGRSANFEDWERRRNEIKKELETFEIGPKPSVSIDDVTAKMDSDLMGNPIIRICVKRDGYPSINMGARITCPNGITFDSECKLPVMIGMNFRPTFSQGEDSTRQCVQVTFNTNDVIPYTVGGGFFGNTGALSDSAPYYQMYPEFAPKNNESTVGKYSAWSWGVSRVIDALYKLQLPCIDLNKIGVTGCSYAGKMALFSGALDERIALTIVQESGGGGINSWRMSRLFTEKKGINVEQISNTNYSWFKQSLKTNFMGNESKLPYDHHELIAMIAPRAVLILGNPDMEWLCDYSGYTSTIAALEVYKTFGIEDRFGYVFDCKHGHCQPTDLQWLWAKRYIDHFMFNIDSAETIVRVTEDNEHIKFGEKLW